MGLFSRKQQGLFTTKELRASDRESVCAQDWKTLSLPVGPDEDDYKFIDVVESMSSLERVWLDFTECDVNDRFVVRVEIEVRYESGPRWVMCALHYVTFGRPDPKYPRQVIVDGNPVGPAPIIGVSGMDGPWPVRVRVAQNAGVERQLRWLVDISVRV